MSKSLNLLFVILLCILFATEESIFSSSSGPRSITVLNTIGLCKCLQFSYMNKIYTMVEAK